MGSKAVLNVYGEVLGIILRARFGPVVEKVAIHVFLNGPAPIVQIQNGIGLPRSAVLEAIRILLKFRLALIVPSPNPNIKVLNYELNHENVFAMLRYQHYRKLTKKKFGDIGEVIFQEMTRWGYMTASQIILGVVERLQEEDNKIATISQIKDVLLSLITAKYVMRIASPDMGMKQPFLAVESPAEMFKHPPLDVRIMTEVQEETQKPGALPDKSIYWTVNFDRFHQDMRDKIIESAFSRKFDENAGEFVRILLQQMYNYTEPWAGVSGAVPVSEIKDIVQKQGTHPYLMAFFDQYRQILAEDSSCLIRKGGDSAGGSLCICLKDAFARFAGDIVHHVILEKFDSKAARIFQIVKTKGLSDIDQIQKLAMIPTKESKRLTYLLHDEHFLESQDVKRSNAASLPGPNKFLSLFRVDLGAIVDMILQHCYKAVFNLLTRRNHERQVKQRLIDKKQRVDTILMGMRAQNATAEQIADIEEMITPPEHAVLENINRSMNKLITAELDVLDTIFYLQMYMKYHK